ncbi:monofunctional biosynthetic peptidoglycan transglycosylase [Methylophaga sp.]|uniref:monofunctional biosynthetic peptidoglycan transglycosylase n=1 Tax=Methylophaga sp. TaxID=2024840 RepID=UPI003F6A2359
MKKFKTLLFRCLLLLLLASVVLSLLMVVPFRWLNPPLTMVMADRWLESSDDFYLHQEWLSWDELPKQAALAIVTSEDQRFPLHQGFDIEAIIKAVKQANKSGQLRGASTISQQVAKNMYLWTGRSWLRKGLEVWFTLLIELTWGKQRILEVYMNIAEWGNGVFGLEAASRYHFNKPASQLSPMQSALLASTLPSPLKYDPARPAQHLVDRARWNLEQQRKLGGVSWLSPISQ